MNTRISFLFAVMTLVVACMALPAKAVTQFTLNNMDGDDLQVKVTLTELAGTFTSVEVKLEVVSPPYYADLRGAFFHLSDESLLTDLLVEGTSANGTDGVDAVTDLDIRANKIDSAGNNSNNIKGQVIKAFGKFDVGIEIGTQGIGKDDYHTVTFVVSHDDAHITQSMFTGQAFAIRAMSVGTSHKEKKRKGSSKLGGIVPDPVDDPFTPGGDPEPDPVATPEPTTAALGLLGLAGVALASRRRRCLQVGCPSC